MCTGTNNTSAFVCTCANTPDGNGAHTRAGLLPAPHRLPTDCSCRTMTACPNLSITVFLFSYPQRSPVSSDLPPVCIRKERLHCPAHSWYLISLQALGANPTTSCLSSWCLWVWGCLYRHAHLLPLAAFPDLLWTRWDQDSGSDWLHSSAANTSSLSFLQKLYIAFLL